MDAIDLYELMPCGCFTLERNLTVVACNEAAAQMMGRPRPSLLGARIESLMPKGTLFFFQTHISPTVEFAGSASELYMALSGPDGQPMHVLMNAARDVARPELTHFAFMPIYRRRLFERELIAARSAAEHAAEQERDAQEQLRAAQAQLAMAERLASVGTLAAGIAHEINNPLTYVSGHLELAERETDARRLAGSLAAARHGVDRIRKIVDSLRSLSRVPEEVVHPVDLAKVVDAALQIAGGEVRQRAIVEVEAPREVVVAGDEGRLGQIVINLVVNAAQAVAAAERSSRILVRVRSADGQGIVDVIDDGPGVPDSLRERIFEPFFTTKPVGHGTGLGLALAHELAGAMRGTLTLEASPTGGAWFRLAVPLYRPGADGAAGSTGTSEVTGSEAGIARPELARRILVVDDDVEVAALFARMLDGHEVHVCHDGVSALELLGHDDDFDVIVCDVVMPRLGGREVHARLCASWPRLASRVVFVSGGAVDHETRGFLSTTSNPVLSKPLDAATLRAACVRAAD